MPISNYTTTIAPDKTIAEIQRIISSKGADKIMVDYTDGTPTALTFRIIHMQQPVSFRLPCNYEGVLKAINKSKAPTKHKNKEQALRTGWRIIKDWIEAQMAIVEAEQANIATIFLPYAVTANGETVAENLLSEKGRQLLLTT